MSWHMNFNSDTEISFAVVQLGYSCPLTSAVTSLFHAGKLLNTHEELRSRPTTWMVSGVLPHIDPEIAKYPKTGENSASVVFVRPKESNHAMFHP